MPLSNSINFVVEDERGSTGSLFNSSTGLSYILDIFRSFGTTTTNNFLQTSLTHLNNVYYQQVGALTNSNILLLFTPYKLDNLLLNINEQEIYNTAFLQSVIGSIPDHSNTNTNFVILQQLDKFNLFILDTQLYLNNISQDNYGHLYSTASGNLSGIGVLTQTDTFGPRLINLLPPSGSTYNNPLTNIGFRLYDQEHTTITGTSINFYINGTQVISGGLNVTPIGFGTTNFTQINPYTYDFIFLPVNAFSPDTLINISGSAIDLNNPINNSSIFNYNFRVWKTGELIGTIIGTADIEAPYLTNLFPPSLQYNVDVDTNISIDIIDDHTGVNKESIILKLEDTLIASGLQLYNQLEYPTTVTSISGGKGYRYLINPLYNLPFNNLINTYVYAEDLYTPNVNIMEDTSYAFFTYNNAYLSISGLELFDINTSTWISLDPSISYEIATSGMDLRIRFLNTSGTGIDTIQSNILYNDITITGTSITEIMSGYEYLVNFHILPDYKTDCDLLFHVVRSGLVNGVTIYNNYHNEILFGAEVCYNPEENFNYLTEIPILIRIADAADYPTLESKFYKFITTVQPKNDLYGAITGLPEVYGQVLGQYLSQNPFFEFGKVMELELTATDYAGNVLIYKWSFKIQERVN